MHKHKKQFLVLIASLILLAAIYAVHKSKRTNLAYGRMLGAIKYRIITIRLDNPTKQTVRLKELQQNVYRQLGYTLIDPSEPIAKIRKVTEQSCQKTFDDWLKIVIDHDSNTEPVDEIPYQFYNEFTMFGHSYVKKNYLDRRYKQNETIWPKTMIDENWYSNITETSIYDDSKAIYNAMVNYPLNGTSGLVVGSMSPSLENYCIKCGVKKITTIKNEEPYNHDAKVSYIQPMEMAEKWKMYQGKYDFVLLFSGIEHTGLGAYGDPLDSLGDIREMQKIRCLLREGGLAFIGLPTGADGVQFNTKRIYGRGRLPLMFAGFKLLGVYYRQTTDEVQLTNNFFEQENCLHYTYVLQKTSDY